MNDVSRRQFLSVVGRGLAFAAGSAFLSEPMASVVGTFDNAYFDKIRRFHENHDTDIHLGDAELKLLKGVAAHLRRVQNTVGYGNFGIVGFDQMVRVGRQYSRVDRFERRELEFLERIFYEDASRLGFFGSKVLYRLTDEIPKREVVKIPRTGQFLYRGESLETYERIKSAIGEEVVLTSGVRGVVKQMYLFLNKAVRTGGNLSRASRSLAPPGYSFHGVGDFDVGKRGFGRANFTERFAKTDVYRRLVDMGFATLRYPEGNLLGVRYEPWHIKVV